MKPVTMTIINPWKKYWSSQESNPQPPVLKSGMLPTKLLGLAKEAQTQMLQVMTLKINRCHTGPLNSLQTCCKFVRGRNE